MKDFTVRYSDVINDSEFIKKVARLSGFHRVYFLCDKNGDIMNRRRNQLRLLKAGVNNPELIPFSPVGELLNSKEDVECILESI